MLVFVKEFLNTPVYSMNSTKDKWLFIAFISSFVTLFLLIFQPFGVNNFDPTNTIDITFLFSMIGFGFVTALSLSFYEFIIVPILFKREVLWVFILRIILELIFIAGSVFLYYNIMGNFHDWSVMSYLSFVFNISVMSIIPIAIILLYNNYKKTKHAFQLLELQPKLSAEPKYVSLSSNNGKEIITLTLNDLLYIEAQDNYISVHYSENDTLKSKLLRATMKEVEEHLKQDDILRCHRSFIINMNKVNKVIKEGHQLQLFIPELTTPILTSRSFVPNIKTYLDTHHK